jgi:pSer/pThr/pTyr-binding forkhead associated (FHA) protein
MKRRAEALARSSESSPFTRAPRSSSRRRGAEPEGMSSFPTILVKITRNARSGQTLAFKQEIVNVGREPGMDVSLPSKEVSRAHCRFEISGGRVLVRDLDSKNGTLLNGHRIEREEAVDSGDNVVVGDFKLWIMVVANADDVASKAALFSDGATIEASALGGDPA